MELEFYQLTNAGNRAENQDRMISKILPGCAVFVVADGLGGHQAGEKASEYFCLGILKFLDKYQPLLLMEPAEKVMKCWVDEAVSFMQEMFANDPYAQNAHTTCAMLYLDHKQAVTVHCGDSRIYRVNQQRVLWRTRDHSMTQQLVDDGVISEREMGLHPDQNQLTRSINIQKLHSVDVHSYPSLGMDEVFILCSDGFWEYIKESELIKLANNKVDREELKKFAKLVIFRAAGNSDNVTVQLVRRKMED